MPSLIDPSLAPAGKHVLHAYVPATEPYSWWEGLDRQSEEYLKKKDEAADFLWSAIEKYVPDARNRAIQGTVQIGTPLTHERFLRRSFGTYGPRVEAGKHTLPGHKTPSLGSTLRAISRFLELEFRQPLHPELSLPIICCPYLDIGHCLDKIRLPKKK
jgi:phytoene dehydrogenase-like protein